MKEYPEGTGHVVLPVNKGQISPFLHLEKRNTRMFNLYVLGFYFIDENKNIILVRKNKPEWQKGLFNAVGGKIESEDISPVHAMRREFLEETGIETPLEDWTKFCTIKGSNPEFVVHCFRAKGYDLPKYTTAQDLEPVQPVAVSLIFDDQVKCIENLKSLVALALDDNPRKKEACITYI